MSSNKIRMATRLAVFMRDNFTCVYCESEAPFIRLSIDHINERNLLPLKKPQTGRHRSPTHHPSRLVTACFSCNSSKKGLSVSAFCDREGLRRSVVWRRIRNLTKKPIEPYREAVNHLLARGEPEWFKKIREGHVEPVDPPSDEDVEAWMIDSL
jgi:5-methylcytosine-specific restriction endonuclease McrA